MCDYGYDDVSEVFVDQWVRARKPRKCCACDETIEARAIYHMHKVLCEGMWQRHDHCERCWSMCEALWRNNDGASIDLDLACGEVWESAPDDVAELAFRTRAEMQERAEQQYADKRTRRMTAP